MKTINPNRVKLVRATADEKTAYKMVMAPVYPLWGWAIIGDPINDVRLAIEDLSGFWSKEDPQYEVMAPAGHMFDGCFCHSLLCHTQKDMIERIKSEGRPIRCEMGDDA